MLVGESARLGTKSRWFVGTSVLALLGVGLFLAGLTKERSFPVPRRGVQPAAPSRTRPVVETDESRVAANFGNLPLLFEPNQGQTDSQVKFLSRNPHYNLFLTSSEAVFTLPIHSSKTSPIQGRVARLRNPRSETQAVLRMEILGANTTPTVQGEIPGEGHTNYLTGSNASNWVRNVPQYARVHYGGIYPGVDLTFYGHQRQLEFDFIVKPGADPAAIALGIQGAEKIRTDQAGDLVLTSAAGDLRLHKPVAYQRQGDVRQPVDAAFVVKGQEVALAVGDYDRARELVIDPSVAYSTYLGGGNLDEGFGIAVDSSRAAYVTGQTTSPSAFPKKGGIPPNTFVGAQDAFITKLTPDGTGLVYSTLLGGDKDSTAVAGTATNGGNAIAVDGLGNAYVVGSTTAIDFPMAGAIIPQQTLAGKQDVFIAKLSADGSTLLYSTYLGGSDDEIGFAIAVDNLFGIYAAGQTKSNDFHVQLPLQGGNNGAIDGFVAKINPDGSLALSSYLGGSDVDNATGVAVDAAHNIYVSGITFSSNFPTTGGAYKQTCGTCPSGVQHVFVTAIRANLSAYLYSTYIYGTQQDEADLIAVDGSSNAYIVGVTLSNDYPTTTGAFQTTKKSASGSTSAFVTKLNPTGSALVYSTFLGGSGTNVGLGIAVDGSGNAYVTGKTTSTDFPTMGPSQPNLGGGADAFVTELNSSGSALLFSTYLGGTKDENAAPSAAIALDTQNPPGIYVTGETASSDFPVIPGSFQTTYASGTDAFIVKYTPVAPQFTVSVGAVSPSAIGRGSTGTATITVTSTGASGSVNLGCSVSTAATPPTCSVSPTSVNLATNGSQTSTLTITTVKTALSPGASAALWLPVPGLALAGAGLLSVPMKKRKLLAMVLGCLAFTGLMLMMACGSGNVGGGGGGGGGGGTTTGSYTVTVTGTVVGLGGASGNGSFSVQ